MTVNTIEDQIASLKSGDQLDMSISNGAIRSSKEATAYFEHGGWVFDIYHSIDDSYTHFTETAFKQVLTGDRSPWDGDINIEYEDRL